MKPSLSIIVIAKNEEKSITKCLNQLKKINFIKKEIILVDSNSIDKTRELAKKYKIKIINIKNSNIYSAGLGRNIGKSEAEGDFILFIDGDQIINLSWLKKYLSFIQDGTFDVVYGKYSNIEPNEKFYNFKEITSKKPLGKYSKKLVGTFLMRNSEIISKEKFDPFMKGEEERDLAYRLIKRGYRIFESKELMAAHFLKKEDTKEIKKEINFLIGSGQLIKKHIFSRFFFEVVKHSLKYSFISIFLGIILLSFILTFRIYLSLILSTIFLIIILLNNKFRINKHFFIIILKGVIFPIKVLQGIILESIISKDLNYKMKKIK